MRWLVLVAALALSVVRVTDAQVGVTICACQPDFYEFTLNFTLTCDDTDITSELPGINDTTCRVSPVSSQNVTDEVPVVVTSVQILELGPPPKYPILFETTFPLQLSDGGKFNYTSVAAKPEDITTEDKVPSGLQLSIIGRNQDEEEILNYWLIVYDNDCGIWPLLEEGQKIGWTVFTGLGVPSQFICPAAPGDVTDYPSESPSSVPTPLAPSPPVVAPTKPPQGVVTPEPTVGGPTSSKDVPTISPTVSCPPTGEKPAGGKQTGGTKGMEKGGGDMGSRRGRILKVGPHPPPSSCPEPEAPTKPKPTEPKPAKPEPSKPAPNKMKQPPMKKVKGEGSASKSKLSKTGSMLLHSRSRRRL
jgi:hypothetical protein